MTVCNKIVQFHAPNCNSITSFPAISFARAMQTSTSDMFGHFFPVRDCPNLARNMAFIVCHRFHVVPFKGHYDIMTMI